MAESPTRSSLQNRFALLPPIYLLPAHLTDDELQDWEQRLQENGFPLTFAPDEAEIFLADVGNPRRAAFELRARGVIASVPSSGNDVGHSRARQIRVVKLKWVSESISKGIPVDLGPYTVYEAEADPPPENDHPAKRSRLSSLPAKVPLELDQRAGIMSRAEADSKIIGSSLNRAVTSRWKRADKPARTHAAKDAKMPTLARQTTDEMEAETLVKQRPVPDYVKRKLRYACQWPTPLETPNDDFVELLKEIKLSRILASDMIGVRAYSTAIASVRAYPYRLITSSEVAALPGCEHKIASLFQEFARSGKLTVVQDLHQDEAFRTMKIFWEIWGVGPTHARAFYYDYGWRSLDDAIDMGWDNLTRQQKIGLKYYDEFQAKIPRKEVQRIGEVVSEHANKIVPGAVHIITGGYRRGKLASGDVDVIVSHPDEEKTRGLILTLLKSLEAAGWVTHTLVVSTAGSRREQQPPTLHANRGGIEGHGFDSLDKGLVVWRDINTPLQDSQDEEASTTNLHRRVDIIVTPWSTVGAAIVGWSGGTTFERDIRRHAKNKFGWKFDSGGLRDRVTGQIIDMNIDNKNNQLPPHRSMDEAERRIFDRLELEWIEPTMRNTL